MPLGVRVRVPPSPPLTSATLHPANYGDDAAPTRCRCAIAAYPSPGPAQLVRADVRINLAVFPLIRVQPAEAAEADAAGVAELDAFLLQEFSLK